MPNVVAAGERCEGSMVAHGGEADDNAKGFMLLETQHFTTKPKINLKKWINHIHLYMWLF